MSRGLRRQAPALVVAGIALLAALGGTVYAAGRIDGHTIKAKSLPGNRLVLGSVPGNRLKPGAIAGSRIAPGSITGTQVDTATLGKVPTAVHADRADSARDADTALNAVNAVNATTVNGHSAGCGSGTRAFAGACWQATYSEAAVSAPAAALSCANQGGELPSPLALAGFAQQPGIAIAAGEEWTGDISIVSGVNLYSVVTVTAAGGISSEPFSETRKYRCVIPLVS
jgi:hypothetical protein